MGRGDSLVGYYCLKFSLSAYSSLFSIIGLVILCIGIYAEVERQKHRTLEGLFLAPAVILLLLGTTMFAVSFIGTVGSLRDNRLLLKVFFWVLLVIFLVELLLLFVEIIFEKQMNAVFHSTLQDGIRHYYDDLDFKNILDFVQQKFSCCGGDEFSDWRVNLYHSCNSSGPLACGVPYTCCIRKTFLVTCYLMDAAPKNMGALIFNSTRKMNTLPSAIQNTECERGNTGDPPSTQGLK